MSTTLNVLDIQYTELCKQLGDLEMQSRQLEVRKAKLVEQADKLVNLASEMKRQEEITAKVEANKAVEAAAKNEKAVSDAKNEKETSKVN